MGHSVVDSLLAHLILLNSSKAAWSHWALCQLKLNKTSHYSASSDLFSTHLVKQMEQDNLWKILPAGYDMMVLGMWLHPDFSTLYMGAVSSSCMPLFLFLFFYKLLLCCCLQTARLLFLLPLLLFSFLLCGHCESVQEESG